MSLQTLLQDSASFRRLVVLMVLIAILLFDWQPEPRLLARPSPQRKDDRPLPGPHEAGPRLARPGRSVHFEASRPLPGARQAARRRPGRHA
jgi:hypothetical protein